MNQTQLGSYEHIALSAIRPSTTNPRKNFDAVALAELTESVKAMGVTVPILVRPLPIYQVHSRGTFVRYAVPVILGVEKMGDQEWQTANEVDARVHLFWDGTEEENEAEANAWVAEQNEDTGGFEIVTGERRYRAAQEAGFPDIPAIIRELTDEQARDLQLVENLQRADLHPVEEADGYRALMAGGTVSLEDVARKAGKTMGYVAQRMKLLQLELPAKTLFHAGHLTLGHALLLARLTPADQDRATRELVGMNHLPKSADMAAKVKELDESHRGRGAAWRLVKQTEAELRQWISGHVLLSLDKVPWSLADPLLVPEAGACTTCPKRTGSNAALFADLTAAEDVCLDSICFATKQKTVQKVAIQAAADQGAPLLRLSAKSSHQPLPDPLPEKTVLRAGQWMKAKARSCENVRKGILTDQPSTYDRELQGMKAGEVLTVCANQKCKVHKHTVDGKSPSGAGGSETYAAQQAKQKLYVEAERPVRVAVIEAVKRSSSDGMYEIRSAIFAQVREYAVICRAMEWEFADVEGTPWKANENGEDIVKKQIEGADIYLLGRIVLLDALARAAEPSPYSRREDDRRTLWEIAEHYGVDADAIAEQIEAEREAAKPKAEPKPVKAAAKSTKKVSAAAQAERKKVAAKKFPSKAKPKVKKLTAAQRKRMADAFTKAASERQKKAGTLDGKQKASGERTVAGVA